jgi:large subunit ribosomal protein L29
MDANEIRANMSVEEVEQKLNDAREELFNLRLRAATEQLDNPMVIRKLRRDIARMQTILNEHRQGLRVLPGKGEGVVS